MLPISTNFYIEKTLFDMVELIKGASHNLSQTDENQLIMRVAVFGPQFQ